MRNRLGYLYAMVTKAAIAGAGAGFAAAGGVSFLFPVAPVVSAMLPIVGGIMLPIFWYARSNGS
ncbi:hypothetical protein D3C71_749500 [compost metagenome]|jgi:hypothetical protein